MANNLVTAPKLLTVFLYQVDTVEQLTETHQRYVYAVNVLW